MNIDFNATTILIVFGTLLISMTMHEAMHAFTSHWLGDDTAKVMGRLSLNPLKHIDPFMTLLLPLISFVVLKVPLLAAKPVPFNPNRVKYDEYGAALVGLAGPFTNLVLAIFGAGLVHLFFGSMSDGIFQGILIFIQVNVALFVFNMIPIPPLDGSRALYAVAPEPVQAVMASMENYGVMLIFALVLILPAFGDILVNLNNAVLRILL